MPIASLNPATGETIETFAALTSSELNERLQKAAEAFEVHRLTPLESRAVCMRRAADILTAEKQRFGEMMTLEMGKPIGAAIAEAEKCALACRFYAEKAPHYLASYSIDTIEGEGAVYFQPLGVVLAVMPWNFPFWQVFRFAAPALMAGNTGVLKHSSNVPRSALAIEEILRRAGFAEGVFQTLLVGSDEVAGIIADARIAAVTLTGSEGAGRSVAEAAGRNLKKTVLELGGSDPFIVMPTADIDAAVATAVKARMINNGQSCIAAKRFIVHEDVYENFVSRFVDGVKSMKIGDPMDPATELGPLATKAIRDELAAQVEKSIAMGARALCGANSVNDRAGFYYEPTVLVDIPSKSPAEDEELFGPVASVWRVNGIDEAVSLANHTRFGLGASAWTKDPVERERFVRDIQSGMVFINGMVASEPSLPFGGVKASGYGRELGEFGIREFVNIKSVKHAIAPANTWTTE
jgi:succinate-semialdehyde dehydrogenase/glutarate-semialdehyde dehydrogenase